MPMLLCFFFFLFTSLGSLLYSNTNTDKRNPKETDDEQDSVHIADERPHRLCKGRQEDVVIHASEQGVQVHQRLRPTHPEESRRAPRPPWRVLTGEEGR